MSIGSSSTPIQAQSPRVAAHLVQNATNAVNTTPAGQGNLASAVMSAQALSAPPAQTGESTSVARGPNVDGTAQPSYTAGSGSTNATAAAQAPAEVSPGQEPGTEKHGRRDEEHSALRVCRLQGRFARFCDKAAQARLYALGNETEAEARFEPLRARHFVPDPPQVDAEGRPVWRPAQGAQNNALTLAAGGGVWTP